jgi:GT2 family glycosyltransferase
VAQIGAVPRLAAAFVEEVRRFGLAPALRKAFAFRPRHLYRYEDTFDADAARAAFAAWPQCPLLSVLMPVYNTDPPALQAALDSVLAQVYPHWELCVVDDASTRPDTRAVLAVVQDPRIRIERLAANSGIAAASNQALAMARGEYVALLDHDDALTRDALFESARAIVKHNPDVLYSDEDIVDERGRAHTAHLKPDYSPDLLLAHNYITHLLVARRDLVSRVGGFRSAYDGAQDYDLILRLVEQANRVAHLRRVLYHWRMSPASTSRRPDAKPYAADAGRRALEDALRRRGIAARVAPANLPHYFHVRRSPNGQPRVSILIPFRDQPDLLETAINAILQISTYKDFEILAIDNGSVEPRTRDRLSGLTARDARVRVLAAPGPFNYALLNNNAAAVATGEYLVLMNNDVEVITPDWIEALLEHAQRPEVGAVGCTLLYPNGRVQHAGIVLGVGGLAGHAHRYLDRRSCGYLNRLQIAQNVSAVTAALLMTRRDRYLEIGGLDAEHLATALNDVDLGLRLRERGWLNVFTPHAQAWHRESASRGYEADPARRARFDAEAAWFRQRHAAALAAGDPYYNPGLSLATEDFSFAPHPPRTTACGLVDLHL